MPPTNNPATNPEAVDPRRPGAAPGDGTNLAAREWALQMDGRRTAGGGGTADLATLYHQVFDNLQQGEQIVETQGIRAALGKYTAAKSASDNVPRQPLEQQLAGIEQALHRGGLNPQQERQMQQQAMDLDSVIRSSVFTRANLGLLMLRNGMKEDGVRLLLEAAQIDKQIWQDYQQMGINPQQVAQGRDQSVLPMMKDDPNFQKHLASALADGARQGGINPQEVVNALRAGFSQGDNTGPVTDASRLQGPTPLVNGRTPWQAACDLGAQVNGPLQPADMQALQQRMLPIIQAADQGTSPRLMPQQGSDGQMHPGLVQLEEAQRAAVLQEYGQIKSQVDQNDGQLYGAINQQTNLSAAQKTQAQEIVRQLEHASSQDERGRLETKLTQMVPGTQPILAQRDALLNGVHCQPNQMYPQGATLLQQLYDLNKTTDEVQAERNQSAMVRFACAETLFKAGDTADARALMAQALVKNQVPSTGLLLQREAQRMGVTQQDVDTARAAIAQAQAAQRQPGTPGAPGAPGAPGVTTGDGTQYRATPIAPGDATAGGTDYRQMAQQNAPAAGDSQAFRTLQQAEQAWEANPDKKAALTATEAQFQQAQAQAEAAYAQLYPQLAGINAQIQQQFPQAAQTEYKQLNDRITAAVTALPQADQQMFAKINGGQATQQETQAFLNAHQDIKQMLTRSTDLTKPIVPLLMQETQIQQAMQDKILAGTMYARALAYAANAPGTTAQDKAALLAKGKDVFTKAFAGVPQDEQVQWLQEPKIGVVGIAVGAIQQADAAGQPGQPPGGDATQARPANLKSSGDAAVDQLAQTQNYGTLLATAHRLIQQNKGDITAAEPYYKAACLVADSQDPAAIQQTIAAKLQDLKRTDITAQQRLQDHQDIVNNIGMLSARVKAHEEYATMLNSVHKFQDAQAQLQLAVDNSKYDANNPQATNFNSRQIQDEVAQIQTDLNNQQFASSVDPTKLNDLSSTAQALQSISQYPIALREEMAQFYLAGGKNPDGSSIGTPIIPGYSPTGIPLAPKNVDTHILDPQKASDLINDALRLQTQINQADIIHHPDLDQNLAALRVATINNAPDNLKKQLQASSSYWQDASSTFWSTAAGLAVAGTLLWATKGKAAGALEDLSAMRLAGAGIAGFGTATATNMGMHRLYYGDQNYTWGNAALQGGGTFLAASGLILAKNGVWAAKTTQFTGDAIAGTTARAGLAPATLEATLNLERGQAQLGQMAAQFEGMAGQTSRLNEVVGALGTGAKNMQFGDLGVISQNSAKLNEMIAAATQNGRLNASALGLAARDAGLAPEVANLTGRMATDAKLATAVTNALKTEPTLLSQAASAAESVRGVIGAPATMTLENAGKFVVGNNLAVPEALSHLVTDYGKTANFADLAAVAQNRPAVIQLLKDADAAAEAARVAKIQELGTAGTEAAGIAQADAAAQAARVAKFQELAATGGADVARLGTRVAEDSNVLATLTKAAKDDSLLTNLGNVWGRTGAERFAVATHISPTWLRGLDPTDTTAVRAALEATAQARPTSLAGKAFDMVASPVRNLGTGLRNTQWGRISADIIPTGGTSLMSRMQAGTAAGLTFNLGTNYVQDQMNYNRGYTDVTPWKAMGDSLTTFTGGPKWMLGINPGNVLVQSLMFAPILGGVKLAPALSGFRQTGSEAWAQARFAKPGMQNALGWTTSTARAEGGMAWNGAFNALNPGGAATTYSQFLRQTLYPTAMYFQLPGVGLAATTIPAQAPWRDALQEIGQPIVNQPGYVPPTLDGNRQQVQPAAQRPQPASAAQRQLNVPVAPQEGTNGGNTDPNNLNTNLTGGM
jgi:hypothetical protein